MPELTITTADGIRLAARVSGPDTAPTIVCVHGYPDNGSMWDAVVAELADRFRMVVYDVRGAGTSDMPAGRDAYRLDRLAADLVAVVDAVSPDRPVHLLAHDWGSIQAWHAVTGDWLRARVSSLTSISGPSLDYAAAWFAAAVRPSPRALRNALTQALHSGYIGFFALPLLPELAWRLGIMRRIIAALEPAESAPRLADGVHGLELYRANMLARLRQPRPLRTEVPVQVLAPAKDRFVGTPLQTEIAAWVSKLWVRVLPGSHWIPRARPGVIARTTAELVDYVDSGVPSRPLRRARVSRVTKPPFAERLVVVTGGAGGIGRASALAFAERGAEVVIADVDSAAANRAAAATREFGACAKPYTVDLSNGDAVAEFAQWVRTHHGVPDIVVNSAGIRVAGPLLHTKEDDWQRAIDGNLWAVIHACSAFATQLVERGEGGHIVNVAAMAGYLPSKVLPAYSTTKSAVLMLTACLRAELAGERIGVSAVCPGSVHTGITARTRFAGVNELEQARRRRASTRLFARRGFGPDRVAADIVRAVQRDRPVVRPTPEAKVAHVLSRATPSVLRAAARLDPRPR